VSIIPEGGDDDDSDAWEAHVARDAAPQMWTGQRETRMAAELTPAGVREVPGSRPLEWWITRRWALLVYAAMTGWSLALFAAARNAYLTFQLPRFDLGNMVQAVWSTAHGRPLEVTHGYGEQGVRLAGHVDPILGLLAPLWLLAPTPLTLAAVQIGACALGALPVFWLGRRHLHSEAAAALLSAAYLMYPWLTWTAVEAFHPVTLAIPLLLYAVWFLDSGRVGAFAVCAVLIAACGELMGFPIAGLGLWFWYAHGRRRAGLAIAGAGLAWTAVCLAVIVPAFRGDVSPFYARFESVGGSPGGLVRTVFTDPGAIVAALSSVDDFAYVLWLGIPLAFVFLLAPVLAAVALPQLLVNLLADSSPTTDPRTHYIAAVIPFLVAATVLGLARLPKAHRAGAASFVLALCAGLSLLVGQWPAVLGFKDLGYQSELSESHVQALRDAAAIVPDDAPVSSTNRVGAHLSGRRYYYGVPIVKNAEWIVLDTHDPRLSILGSIVDEWDPAGLERFRRQIASDPRWVEEFERDGVLVFRKVSP
jgi:uncharacterized membrane protein